MPAVAGNGERAQRMSGNRLLGQLLLAGAAGVTLIMLAWLAVSGARGGGIVLGLLLLFVIAGPLAGAGWYVLSSGKEEAREEQAFAGKRRVLEADRTFRTELAAELRQLSRRPELPGARLSELAEDLERRTYDAPEWFDTVHLTDDDLATLRRYDDLVWERVRWLSQHGSDTEASAREQAVRSLAGALDERRDLLLRGRRAPSAAPGALLRSGEPSRGREALAALGMGDAVTYETTDFLVEAVASHFSEGQTWKLVRLDPTSPDAKVKWLYVGPEALEVALLDEPRGLQPGAHELVVEEQRLALVGSGTATVDVTSRSGNAQGVLVSYWRYADGDARGFVEQWPDGDVRGYGGKVIRPSDLQVWPAAVRA